jgi:hypothetical protein
MRRLFVAAFLAAGVAVAVAQDAFLKGDELAAEIAKSCADGCVTFSREEADLFQQQIEAFVQQKAQEAYELGKRDARQRCASLI